MDYIYLVLIGVVIGFLLRVVYERLHSAGTLTTHSDGEEVYLFFKMNKDIPTIARSKYVTVAVDIKDISRN